MPAYNASKYIRAAIDSVLGQTEQDFELIVINDGSKDDTESIVRNYDSPKILYYKNEKNLGIPKTYNRALKLVRGKYIAIAESDDISHPQRLEAQSYFFDQNPNVGMVGGKIKIFSEESPSFGNISVSKVKTQYTPAQIRSRLLGLGAILNHNETMYRASVFAQHNITYNENIPVGFCPDLFVRIAQVTDVAYLKNELLAYRSHPQSHSIMMGDVGVKQMVKTFVKFINENCNANLSENLWTFHKIKKIDRTTTFSQIKDSESFYMLNDAIEKFLHAKKNDAGYDLKTLKKRAAGLLYGSLLGLAGRVSAREIYAGYWHSKLLRINYEKKFRLFRKALLHNKH